MHCEIVRMGRCCRWRRNDDIMLKAPAGSRWLSGSSMLFGIQGESWVKSIFDVMVGLVLQDANTIGDRNK